ncbi:MAG: hypothetical protein DRJ31_03170 [Candidatus Methanomethylicota archaeon]|uniref:Uncharacterized protein n=1 Tax=Thermoproteota archaeon TaxID=2056631 RepID=A0A497ES95_9CREN|nr:MAG: hypothetical protein DRJ31_03170 [Candidatus Verstraetearchaeota archaeon]
MIVNPYILKNLRKDFKKGNIKLRDVVRKYDLKIWEIRRLVRVDRILKFLEKDKLVVKCDDGIFMTIEKLGKNYWIEARIADKPEILELFNVITSKLHRRMEKKNSFYELSILVDGDTFLSFINKFHERYINYHSYFSRFKKVLFLWGDRTENFVKKLCE